MSAPHPCGCAVTAAGSAIAAASWGAVGLPLHLGRDAADHGVTGHGVLQPVHRPENQHLGVEADVGAPGPLGHDLQPRAGRAHAQYSCAHKQQQRIVAAVGPALACRQEDIVLLPLRLRLRRRLALRLRLPVRYASSPSEHEEVATRLGAAAGVVAAAGHSARQSSAALSAVPPSLA